MTLFLFAKAHDDPIIVAIGAVLALIALLIRLLATYDVDFKNGVPYCPKCNRQISRKRDQCRSCGHYLYRFESASPSLPTYESDWAKADRIRDEAKRAEDERLRREHLAEKSRQLEADRIAAFAARRQARLDSYAANGIKAGPLAWLQLLGLTSIECFRGLPDLIQALMFGLGFGVAFAVAIVTFMRMRN